MPAGGRRTITLRTTRDGLNETWFPLRKPVQAALDENRVKKNQPDKERKHMKQKRIETVNVALGQATEAIGGATEHGEAIGMKQNNAAAITEDRDELIEKRDEHTAAKVE